ncbi:MAG: helix-turn-helix domain-containing protein [Lachnospiraceae bacterium]|nr:helix-turn-helix domain-containing protein [Lachnospiraceae bacterium]MDD3617016.1 helix-turn-helix domain-containing protein [Lachnospiraceae bacterium]
MEQTNFSVSEAVRMVGVQSHVLRYWEEEMLLPISRNNRGHRTYTEQDIRIFLSVKELKQKGLSLKQMKTIMPLFYGKGSAGEFVTAHEPIADTTQEDAGKILERKIIAQTQAETKARDELEYEHLEQELSERSVSIKGNLTVDEMDINGITIEGLDVQDLEAETMPGNEYAVSEDMTADVEDKMSAESGEKEQKFFQIMNKLVKNVIKERKKGEGHYKSLDKRIRSMQLNRKMEAAAKKAEKEEGKRKAEQFKIELMKAEQLKDGQLNAEAMNEERLNAELLEVDQRLTETVDDELGMLEDTLQVKEKLT